MELVCALISLFGFDGKEGSWPVYFTFEVQSRLWVWTQTLRNSNLLIRSQAVCLGLNPHNTNKFKFNAPTTTLSGPQYPERTARRVPSPERTTTLGFIVLQLHGDCTNPFQVISKISISRSCRPTVCIYKYILLRKKQSKWSMSAFTNWLLYSCFMF